MNAAAIQTQGSSGAGGQRKPPLLDVRNLRVHYPIRRGGLLSRHIDWIRAVDGVTLEIHRGETLGLVGESGCGKSTTGRGILQMERPTSGEVRFDGSELVSQWRRSGRSWRWSTPLLQLRKRMQMIFQDPYACLNPRMTVESIVGEPLRNFRVCKGQERRERVQLLMKQVGMDPRYIRRYPHEFSGGQRQRIGIARALALEPELIVADEPISALDVSIQAQIMNLMAELQKRLGLTYLFIAHDLAVVRHISDRIAVMYLGRVVELASSDDLIDSPRHPYTQALISAVPVPDPGVQRSRERIVLKGDVPSPISPPSGCPFHPRCPLREERCEVETPVLHSIGGGHQVACHLVKA
ncbi:MAG: ATP-binding cassette domain-containing protein [Planctomycetales bacterium]|nr:ATP-binding cassette domain-containing protein [Planctomycetales bacterium]